MKTMGRTVAASVLVFLLMGGYSHSAQAQENDDSPPQLSLPGSITVEATGPTGVNVSFDAVATDIVDPDPVVTCKPSSGSEFNLGTTRVVCTATDDAGNTSSGSFPVTVRDITPPLLTLPASFKTEASSKLGALVIFTNIATDSVDPSPVVECEPSSGSTFPVGTTTVSCAATDASGNVSGDHFMVTVEDTTPPTITGRMSPLPNVNAWHNTEVAVTFNCADSASGISTCIGDEVLVNNGANQRVRGTSTDTAGNSAFFTMPGINIDRAPPVITITSPRNGAEFSILHRVPAGWNVADALSGVGSAAASTRQGEPIDTSTLGAHTFAVTATDLAGNRATTTHTYTVAAPFSTFLMSKVEVTLEGGAPRDEFRLAGVFELGPHSNDIDIANERTTIILGDFTQVIPAGSFVPEEDGAYRLDGVPGGIVRAQISDDGQFSVTATRLDLLRVSRSDPVPISLAIGDDVGNTTVQLTRSGQFTLETRPALDFFGVVEAVEHQTLHVRKGEETHKVVLTDDTNVRLIHKQDARAGDLVAGDRVAVSLAERDGELFGDQIMLLHKKTRFKHLPGEVIAITDTHLTIRPSHETREPITFSRGPGTPIQYFQGETALAPGSHVIVVAEQDPLTGLYSPEAKGINVIAFGEPDGDPGGEEPPPPDWIDHAIIPGVLKGVTDSGEWTIGGISVAVGVETKFDEGLTVGQMLSAKAALRADGSLLATEVRRVSYDTGITGTAELEGPFQGLDEPSGRWIIGSALVTVRPSINIDGVPRAGQRLKVFALVSKDGALLAREVQYVEEQASGESKADYLKLKGTFLGVDPQGNWIIHGARVAVDRQTRLEGDPAIGHQIEAVATVRDDNSYLALSITGRPKTPWAPAPTAYIRGAIEKVLEDGSPVVNGVEVSLSALTKLDRSPQPGDFVEVTALVRPGRAFLAAEIDNHGANSGSLFTETSPVAFQGLIDDIGQNMGLVVNGIPVTISPLTNVRGYLVEGTNVEIEGLLQANGSVIASGLKGEVRKTTINGINANIYGAVDGIDKDEDGNITSVAINGLTTRFGHLTSAPNNIQIGLPVKVQAVVIDGMPVARQLERTWEEIPWQSPVVEVRGTIESIGFDSEGSVTNIIVDGLSVRVVRQPELASAIHIGDLVTVRGTLNDDGLMATEVTVEQAQPEESARIEFEMEGSVRGVVRDEQYHISGLDVNGNQVVVQALTRVNGDLEEGRTVKVTGVISEGSLIARKIEVSHGQ